MRIIKTLGDVFIPILPAIVASGLMMGIVKALAKAIPTFAESDWFGILNMISNMAFVFLLVIIAMSAARVFGDNCYLGAVIGMIMIHPNLINAWSVGGMNQTEISAWNLFGEFTIKQVGYQVNSVWRDRNTGVFEEVAVMGMGDTKISRGGYFVIENDT